MSLISGSSEMSLHSHLGSGDISDQEALSERERGGGRAGGQNTPVNVSPSSYLGLSRVVRLDYVVPLLSTKTQVLLDIDESRKTLVCIY